MWYWMYYWFSSILIVHSFIFVNVFFYVIFRSYKTVFLKKDVYNKLKKLDVTDTNNGKSSFNHTNEFTGKYIFQQKPMIVRFKVVTYPLTLNKSKTVQHPDWSLSLSPRVHNRNNRITDRVWNYKYNVCSYNK